MDEKILFFKVNTN